MTWRKQVEEHIEQLGLKKKNATDRTKWRNGVYELSGNTKKMQSPSFTEIKPDLKSQMCLHWIPGH